MATAQLNETTRERSEETATAACPQKGKLKRILGRVLLALAAFVAILCVIIAMQPADFAVSRSATMAAPPADVFAQVNDFHNWEAWSPWAKLDPEAKTAYDGPTSGEGSKFSWDGNSNVGTGSMTIVASQPDERIRIKLDFVRPLAGTSNVEFTFKPQGDQTTVTWSMAGKNSFFAKAIGLVMDCEEMCAEQMDLGLAGIKSIVEKKNS
jgi:uncharacterized protein YndB with AHSA1/START domain